MSAPTATSPTSPRARRYDARREELIDAAMRTVFQRGLARTSLREIASHSAFSHGVLHYYFTDKDELVRECLDRYCASLLVQFDAAIVPDQSLDEFLDRLLKISTDALEDGLEAQRLWYDVNTESMYAPEMRDQIAAMRTAMQTAWDGVLAEFGRITGRAPRVPADMSAAMWDGIWGYWLQRTYAGHAPSRAVQAAGIHEYLHLITI